MRTLDPDNLDRWISSWKRAVKEPEELLLGMGSFVNVVQAALGELERPYRVYENKRVKREGEWWESKVLNLMEWCFEAGTPTVALLRAEHCQAMDELEALLRAGRAYYDVGRIYPLLKKIESSPSTRFVGEGLLGELLGKGDPLSLLVFAQLLARRASANWSGKDLEDLPKKTLTRSYVSLLLESRAGNLGSDEGLGREVGAIRRGILREASYSRPERASESESGSLLDALGDEGFGRRLAYRFLEDLGRTWANALRDRGVPAGDATDHKALLSLDEEGRREIGREAVRGYALTLLRRGIQVDGSSEKISGAAEGLGRRLHDKLVAAGVFAEGASRWGEDYEDVVARTALAATIDASVRHVYEELADRVAAETPASVLLEVGSLLEETMSRGAAEGVFSEPEILGDINEACAAVLARRYVQGELGRLLIPLSEGMLARVTPAANVGLTDDVADEGSVARFWGRWKESFAREFGVFEYLPWDAVGEEDLWRLLDELIGRVAGPVEQWRAVFRVGGIDLEGYPEGSVLRMGNVALYDPGVYDFGEGRWRFLEKEPDGPYAVARVKVEADGTVDAERAGRRRLADALNVLTFAYSNPRRDVGGFKCEVHPGVYVYRVDGSRGQYRPRQQGAKVPAAVRARERDIGELASAYRGMLASVRTSERDEGEPGEIRPGFLRAVHWYARGYWEPDPLQKFLTHWIGLEHLFVGGEGSKKPLVVEVPRLVVNWRRLRGLMFMGMTLRELVSRVEGIAPLKAEADERPYFEGWNEYARVLLDPAKVKMLALLASEHDPALADRLSRFVEELRALAQDYEGVAGEVEAQRERESFKLALLGSARNDIVHEARRDHPNIEAYAEKIERVLADVLDRIVADALEEKPGMNFVKQLASREEEQPWLEGRRGIPVTEEVIERLLGVGKDDPGNGFEDDSAGLLDEARAERAEAP